MGRGGTTFRRMRAKLGPPQATVATAHKIARVVYHVLTHHEAFEETTGTEYTQQCRDREVRPVARTAATRGTTRAPQATIRVVP